jgi:hypothetical protein
MLQQLKEPTVKAAIVALQNGDVKGWNRLFEPDATLLDDGQPRDLKRFSNEALGHERFLSIDKVSSDGLSIEGRVSIRYVGSLSDLLSFHHLLRRSDRQA